MEKKNRIYTHFTFLGIFVHCSIVAYKLALEYVVFRPCQIVLKNYKFFFSQKVINTNFKEN